MKPTVVNILLVISFSKSNCLSQLFVLERSKTVGLHIPRGIGGGPERGGGGGWKSGNMLIMQIDGNRQTGIESVVEEICYSALPIREEKQREILFT